MRPIILTGANANNPSSTKMPTLPPWLTIDPIAPIPLALRGFGLGAQVGESLRQGEQQSAQFNAELGARQARAQQEYDQHMQLERDKAATAARNLVGMQTYQGLVQRGVPKADALVQAAPDLFYNRAYELPTAMHQISQEEQAINSAKALERHNLTTESQRDREQAFREEQAKIAPDKSIRHVGNKVVKVNPDGTVTELFDASNLNPMDRLEAAAAYRLLYGEYSSAKDKERAKDVINRLRSGSGKSASILDLPDTEDALKAGQIYQTKRGAALWDGEKFIRQ